MDKFYRGLVQKYLSCVKVYCRNLILPLETDAIPPARLDSCGDLMYI